MIIDTYRQSVKDRTPGVDYKDIHGGNDSD